MAWRVLSSGLRQSDELRFASHTLGTVEINGSFYSLQRPTSYARWYAETPDDFVFSVKGGRYITHMKRLKDVREALANFFASGVLELGHKLGPFLWQLPPSLRFDADVLGRFLRLLPKTVGELRQLACEATSAPELRGCVRPVHVEDAARPLRHTLEVRHDSFDTPAFYDALTAHQVACCVADTAGKFPMLDRVTSDFAYVRLHGSTELYSSAYSSGELEYWSRRILDWGNEGLDCYVYFDNDIKVHAPFDAMDLERLLLGSTQTVEDVKRRVARAPVRAR